MYIKYQPVHIYLMNFPDEYRFKNKIQHYTTMR